MSDTQTASAVCYSCAHIQPYPQRYSGDEECAPYVCENCRRQTLDIGWDHDEAIEQSERYLSEAVAK